MAGSSKHALPEHWTELSAAREHRKQCAERVEELKTACITKCRKPKVTDCSECYAKVLDTMRARYCDARGREWFSQRSAFLEELDVMFTDGKKHKLDLKAIEDHIESEKEAWYRWVLRTYPAFLLASDRGVDAELLRSMLDDPDTSRDQLIQRVWDSIGKSDEWSGDVDTVVNLLTAGTEESYELKKTYIKLLFKDRKTYEILPNALKYLDQYEHSGSMPPEEIVNRIVQDQRAAMTSQPQRDKHLARLADLHRARTAMEQTRQKAKSQGAQAVQTPTVAEELYNLPPCEVCGGVVPHEEVLSCTLCQLVTQIGGRKKLTVYCSTGCYEKGHGEHVDKEHDCEARDNCVQNFDEEEVEDDGTQTVICDACIDDRESAIYCSVRCAKQNLPHHNEMKHDVKTGPDEIDSLVSPLWKLAQKTLKEGNPGLSFSLLD